MSPTWLGLSKCQWSLASLQAYSGSPGTAGVSPPMLTTPASGCGLEAGLLNWALGFNIQLQSSFHSSLLLDPSTFNSH